MLSGTRTSRKCLGTSTTIILVAYISRTTGPERVTSHFLHGLQSISQVCESLTLMVSLPPSTRMPSVVYIRKKVKGLAVNS